jgi:hypothetical protein
MTGSATKQSILSVAKMDCFASLAMSDEAIHSFCRQDGLLRFARNDGESQPLDLNILT